MPANQCCSFGNRILKKPEINVAGGQGNDVDLLILCIFAMHIFFYLIKGAIILFGSILVC